MDLPAPPSGALDRALASLAELEVVPVAADLLARDAPEQLAALREEIVREVPAFSATGNPQVLQDLAEHAGAHLSELQRLLAGAAPGDFAFVRSHAQRRAEQRFPLEAVLHAYRCGHKVLANWMRQLALATRPVRREAVVTAVADFAIEYTNAASAIATAEYVDHTRVLAEGAGDQRMQLLNILLAGHDESDGRVARILRRAGYLDERQVFCVALAQSVDPLEMENVARVQRIVDAMTQAAGHLSARAVVGVRDQVVIAVISDVRRVSGWTAPRTRLVDRVQPRFEMLGPAVLIGLSNDQPSTGLIPQAFHEASVALDFASVTQRVVRFPDVSVRRLLLHRGGEYVQAAMPAWMTQLADADANANGTLIATLHALADADLNVQRAARALRAHPNTLYARIARINALVGRNVQCFHDLSEVLLAVDCRAAN